MIYPASPGLLEELRSSVKHYARKFEEKKFEEEPAYVDTLMAYFGITDEMKRRNSQYWARELGSLYQEIVTKAALEKSRDYFVPKTGDSVLPCDLVAGECAIDMKYRMGSGDSGTLQKLRRNGMVLQSLDVKPILLVHRDDNLPAALSAAKGGGWSVVSGEQAIDFVRDRFSFDLEAFLVRSPIT
jgi:hypothetical protein